MEERPQPPAADAPVGEALPPPEAPLRIRSKIWLEDAAGGLVFGTGRLRILEAVSLHGSILAAARELRMSYRAVWGKIKVTEERLGLPLLTRQIGGLQGGGSALTPAGEQFVVRFRALQARIQRAADDLFAEARAPALPNPCPDGVRRGRGDMETQDPEAD
jgi:molybdate transport system regulatory protein